MFQRIITAVALLCASACASYDLSVNERVLYTPRPLFSEYTLTDTALATCVSAEIQRLKITQASQLRSLDCSGQAVAELAGLGLFTGLARLQLSDNNISDISELSKLSLLQQLRLDRNEITSPQPLYELPALQYLDLRGNSALLCPGSTALVQLHELQLPGHCLSR